MEGQDIQERVEPVTGFWFHEGILRPVWKLSAFTGCYFAVLFALVLVVTVSGIEPGGVTGIQVLLLVPAFAATALGTRADGRPFLSIGLRPSRAAVRHGLAGATLAGAMMLIITAVLTAAGAVALRIQVITIAHATGIVADGMFLYLLVALNEELLIRGYPLQTLMRGGRQGAALILTALVFTVMHAWNASMTWRSTVVIFLAGIWLGRAYIVSGALWFPIGLHFGWNFVQGTILGFPVSGLRTTGVFSTTSTGADWISGGAFGPEGSAVSAIVLLVGTGILWHPGVVARLGFAAATSSMSAAADAATGADDRNAEGT